MANRLSLLQMNEISRSPFIQCARVETPFENAKWNEMHHRWQINLLHAGEECGILLLENGTAAHEAFTQHYKCFDTMTKADTVTFKPTLFGFLCMKEVTDKMHRLSELSHYPSSYFCCASIIEGEKNRRYIQHLLDGGNRVDAATVITEELTSDGVASYRKLHTAVTSMNITADRILKHRKSACQNKESRILVEELSLRILHPDLPVDKYGSYDTMRGPSRKTESRMLPQQQTALFNIAKQVHHTLFASDGRDNHTGKCVDVLVADIARIYYQTHDRRHQSFDSLLKSMELMHMEKTKAERIIVRLMLLRGDMLADDPYRCQVPNDITEYYLRPLHDNRFTCPKASSAS
jgi:hypothetical protein